MPGVSGIRKGSLVDRKSSWLILIAVAILSAFVVPYTLLRNVDAWYGSFLFWVVITAVVIGVNAIVSASWKDEK